jgi:hypothetical protein
MLLYTNMQGDIVFSLVETGDTKVIKLADDRWIKCFAWVPFVSRDSLVVSWSDGEISLCKVILNTDPSIEFDKAIEFIHVMTLMEPDDLFADMIRVDTSSNTIVVPKPGSISELSYHEGSFKEISQLKLPNTYVLASLRYFGRSLHVATQNGCCLVFCKDANGIWEYSESNSRGYYRFLTTDETEVDDEVAEGQLIQDSNGKSPAIFGFDLSLNGYFAAVCYETISPLSLNYLNDSSRRSVIKLFPIAKVPPEFEIDEAKPAITFMWDVCQSLCAPTEHSDLHDYLQTSSTGKQLFRLCQDFDRYQRQIWCLVRSIPSSIAGADVLVQRVRSELLLRKCLHDLESVCQRGIVVDGLSTMLKIQYCLSSNLTEEIVDTCTRSLSVLNAQGMLTGLSQNAFYSSATEYISTLNDLGPSRSMWEIIVNTPTDERVRPAFPSIEMCALCDSGLEFDCSLKQSKCLTAEKRGHKWSRCGCSFRFISDPWDICECPSCNSKYSKYETLECLMCGCKLTSVLQ